MTAHTNLTTLPFMAVNPEVLEHLRSEGLITLKMAAKHLRTSPQKIRELVRTGALVVFPHPLDRRLKLVRERDLAALLRVDTGTTINQK